MNKRKELYSISHTMCFGKGRKIFEYTVRWCSQSCVSRTEFSCDGCGKEHDALLLQLELSSASSRIQGVNSVLDANRVGTDKTQRKSLGSVQNVLQTFSK